MLDVASYRLATHLGLAFVILGFIAWFLFHLSERESDLIQRRRSREGRLFKLSTGLLHFTFLQILIGALVAGIFGIDPRITDMVAQQGANLLTLKFGREDESEADLIGMELGARAGFDPRSGVTLWEKMSANNQNAPPEWMSTHPSGSSRIQEMQANMDKVLPLYQRAKPP